MPNEGPERPSGTPSDPPARKGEADAWGAFGLVASGVLVWGGVGGLVSARIHNQLPLVVGLLVGMFAGLYLVWIRYGRS